MDNLKDILTQIESFGQSDTTKSIEINQALNLILDYSSGLIRIKAAMARKFELILNSVLPDTISPLSVRCLYCRKVISYPAWHLRLDRAEKAFHYFVCCNGKKIKLDCQR